MGINIILWKYILKDQNESNDTYLVLLLNNNNCEKKAKITYKWYSELLELYRNNCSYAFNKQYTRKLRIHSIKKIRYLYH